MERVKLVWQQIQTHQAFILSIVAVVIALTTCVETKLTRQQSNAKLAILERFDDGISSPSLHPAYTVIHCRTILQITNQGGSNAALTNVGVNVTFDNSQIYERWQNNVMPERVGATISQPLSVNPAHFAVYDEVSKNESVSYGFELFTIGVTEEKDVHELIQRIIAQWEKVYDGVEASKGEDAPSEDSWQVGRQAYDFMLLPLLRANSYSESSFVPSTVNNLPYIVTVGETRQLTLDLVFLMRDPDEIVSRHARFQAAYSLVFDNGFTDRHTTDCRDSNRLPSF